MKLKRNYFRFVFLCLFGFLHTFSFATPQKKNTPHKTNVHKTNVRIKNKKTRAYTVKPFSRPDLKIVQTTANPVSFFAAGLGQKNKNKIADASKQMVAFADPRESLYNNLVPLNSKIPQVDWESISANMYTKNGKVYSNYNGLKLELTINPEIQEASEKYLNQQSRGVISSSTAIIEPQTGRLLALAQGGNKGDAATSVSSRGPAASLIKIVTSAAAIERENLDPSFALPFRGGCGRPANENWIENAAKDNTKISFEHAFGSSCNTFFARLALYHAGLAALKTYAEKFMFNKPIPSDLKIQTSLFLLPDPETATPQEIAEAGSGFGATKLSPIHAALLSATVANGGIMMAPYLIEAAYNAQGNEIYRAHPTQIGRVISEDTANKISVLMLATTSVGTSRRVFHKRGTRANLDDIGGKTGTLLDLENRDILYTWFSGIASMGSPKSIAIGTVVASPQNYVVHANAVAQTIIAQYFRIQKIEMDE